MTRHRRDRRRPAPNILRVLRSERAKSYGPFAPSLDGDVGYNLTCVQDTIVPPGVHLPPTDIPVEIRVKLPPGTFARIESRSGTHSKFPTLLLCAAPIDNGYTGPLDPRFRNIGSDPVLVPAGKALAQLVLYTSLTPLGVDVEELPETDRGTKGFGSTGK